MSVSTGSSSHPNLCITRAAGQTGRPRAKTGDRSCTADPSTNAIATDASNNASGKRHHSTSTAEHGVEAYASNVPCFHPLTAWRTRQGEVLLGKEPPDSHQLHLPCGGCLGCRRARALAWALRCQLELQQHPQGAVFTTLTYDDEHKPATLLKDHIAGFLKRLRRAAGHHRTLRFFASGEYGERTQRPHYHAILYGLTEADRELIQNNWCAVRHHKKAEALGHTHTVRAGLAAIAYTAGYCQKKIGYRRHTHERVDAETGEVYTWQPPFLQMSRNPGIGAHAKQWPESWRLYAIKDGHKMSVPRYLHEAWKQQATEQEIQQLREEKETLTRYYNKTELAALEKITEAQQAIAADSRHY